MDTGTFLRMGERRREGGRWTPPHPHVPVVGVCCMYQSKGHIETPFTRFPKFTDYSKDAYSPTEQRRKAKDTHSLPPTSRMPRAKLEQATLGELSKYIKAPPSTDQDDAQDGDRHGSDVAPSSGPRVKGKGVEDDQAWESKYGVQKEWTVHKKQLKDKQGAGKHHALGGAVPVNPQTTEMARRYAILAHATRHKQYSHPVCVCVCVCVGAVLRRFSVWWIVSERPR